MSVLSEWINTYEISSMNWNKYEHLVLAWRMRMTFGKVKESGRSGVSLRILKFTQGEALRWKATEDSSYCLDITKTWQRHLCVLFAPSFVCALRLLDQLLIISYCEPNSSNKHFLSFALVISRHWSSHRILVQRAESCVCMQENTIYQEKRNKLQTQTTMCIKLKKSWEVKLRYKKLHIIWLHLYETPRKDESIKTESRLLVTWG